MLITNSPFFFIGLLGSAWVSEWFTNSSKFEFEFEFEGQLLARGAICNGYARSKA